MSAGVRVPARQRRRAGQPCALVNAATNSLIALRALVSAEIHRYAERPQLPHTVCSVRRDAAAWRLRAWSDRYLGRRLIVMSRQIAVTGPFRGRPRAALVDSATKCCVTGRVTEDIVAAQNRWLCRRARYPGRWAMLLSVCLIGL